MISVTFSFAFLQSAVFKMNCLSNMNQTSSECCPLTICLLEMISLQATTFSTRGKKKETRWEWKVDYGGLVGEGGEGGDLCGTAVQGRRVLISGHSGGSFTHGRSLSRRNRSQTHPRPHPHTHLPGNHTHLLVRFYMWLEKTRLHALHRSWQTTNVRLLPGT